MQTIPISNATIVRQNVIYERRYSVYDICRFILFIVGIIFGEALIILQFILDFDDWPKLYISLSIINYYCVIFSIIYLFCSYKVIINSSNVDQHVIYLFINGIFICLSVIVAYLSEYNNTIASGILHTIAFVFIELKLIYNIIDKTWGWD